MKTYRSFLCLCLVGLFVVSCEKESTQPILDAPVEVPEFTVPEIPDEIASLMSDEDLILFKDGPGQSYLDESALKSARRGRWHPVLMKLDYFLQIWPISSCDTWSGTPCIPDQGCVPSGACGFTVADGEWLFRPVHSEYYPVFCFPDYAGHGEGFHKLGKRDILMLKAENTPFEIDEDGNSTFRRYGHYMGDQSTGKFEGASGWEIAISYTAAENSPSNPTGQGQSTVIIFGWVYY